MDSDNDRGGSVLDSVGSVSDLFTIDILRLICSSTLAHASINRAYPKALMINKMTLARRAITNDKGKML
ncbi:hypothetical protein GCM10009124_26740 [Shewanella xiamenensis]|nr:hypothetical protein GCM10009124_26740 [Shewanella xiamenensis]